MKFIVLLFTVMLQKRTVQEGYHRNKAWFSRLLKPFNVSEMGTKGQIAMFLGIILAPCIAIGLFVASLNGLLGSVVSIVIQVLLFLYILGRDDFSSRVTNYKACWARADYQGAYHCAQEFLSLEEQASSQSPLQLHKTVQEAMVSAWFRRFFTFAFWFLVAGIAGPLIFLLSIWFYANTKAPWVKSLLHALSWAPVRLLAVTIALAGDFVKSFSTASRFVWDFDSTSQTVLHETMFKYDEQTEDEFDCSKAPEELEATNQLMQRSAIIWLCVVAALTVFAGF